MAKTDKGLLFFYDWKIAFEALSGDDCKALLLAMLDYKQNGTQPPEFEGSAKIAAAFIFPAIDRSIKCADAGRSGGLKTQNLKADSDSASSDASRVASTTKQNKNKTRLVRIWQLRRQAHAHSRRHLKRYRHIAANVSLPYRLKHSSTSTARTDGHKDAVSLSRTGKPLCERGNGVTVTKENESFPQRITTMKLFCHFKETQI